MKKASRTARPGRRAPRQLSESEHAYLRERDSYRNVIRATVTISVNQHGIDTDGRGLRGMRIFTRQTVVAASLHRMLPRPSPLSDHKDEHWDITSVASLSRNLLEGYLSLHYFGTEKVTAEEAELRFFIAQLHRNVEWYEIRKLHNPDDPSLAGFKAGIREQKARIQSHPFLPSLPPAQRRKALSGSEMYRTKGDFERELSTCKQLRRDFRLLSNLIHPAPLAIERIDNDRGRGTGTDPDVDYILMCTVIARRYLAASTVAIADHFPDALASRFSKALDPIRPLCTAD